MNTKHLPATGKVIFAEFIITFVTNDLESWASFYAAELDDEMTREYNDVNEMMQAITLFMTSETTRKEIFAL